MSDKVELRGLSCEELQQQLAELGQPPFRARQVFRWVHRHRATSFDQMSNLGQELRAQLSERFELAPLEVETVEAAEDGTRKLRLKCADGALIEAVLIPREDKLTLCISSQVGCALGCRFCATATLGIKRNLRAAEIVDQVYRAAALLEGDERVTNLVFMGMGEPLANLDPVIRAVDLLCDSEGQDFSPRRITISTAGLVPGIRRLGKLRPNVGLALSLHATTDALRQDLMPINKRWPLQPLMQALREYPLPRRRRITIEYMVLAGLNHSPADVKRLAQLLDRIPVKINLLPFNPWRDDQPDLLRPTSEDLEVFAEGLRAKGLTATVRHSRGLDIAAACGQLALAAQDRKR